MLLSKVNSGVVHACNCCVISGNCFLEANYEQQSSQHVVQQHCLLALYSHDRQSLPGSLRNNWACMIGRQLSGQRLCTLFWKTTAPLLYQLVVACIPVHCFVLLCNKRKYHKCGRGDAGYCQLTCGRCNCAESVTQVLQKLQANTFLQAATMTGMKAQFDLPGFTATVLAPSDAAFATFLHGTVISAWLNHC